MINNKHWVFRFKLYHLPFWFAYHFLWWTLRLGSPVLVATSLLVPHAAAKFLFYLVFQMIGVYFNFLVLIPKFLEKGKYVQYTCLIVLTTLAISTCIVSGYFVSAAMAGMSVEQLYGVGPGNYFSLFEANALPSTAAAMTLAMSIRLTKNWIRASRREKELEREKLETELKFLKSQFNPHFLFNTINSIFVLINKNPKVASESLAKFSDLLRYQLYECNEQQIPLSQEIAYIENFIELEKLRRETTMGWSFEIENSNHHNLTIAPFILMPFIENAFKHLSQHKRQENWLRMKIHCEEKTLHFTISNSVSQHGDSSHGLKPYKGIGLPNVRRRLELLYTDRYFLDIQDHQDEFCVAMTLDLSVFEPAVVKVMQVA